MSSFMVSEKTLSVAADYISSEVSKDGWLKRNFPLLNRAAKDLFKDLFVLNYQAVDNRYNGKSEIDNIPSFNLMPHYNQIIAYKQMKCLHYQCSEYGAADTDLYKELSKFISITAERIVSSLKEYKLAPWGVN